MEFHTLTRKGTEDKKIEYETKNYNKNIIFDENNSKYNDKTFNHLKKLQKKIKKTSALKELCK